MKPNQIVIPVVVGIIALGAGFFGGMKYQESKIPGFQGKAFEARNGQGGQMMFNGSGDRTQMRNGTALGFRPVSGKIIAKDDTSITVEMEDGSSKIVILADNTNINKTEGGSREDLTEGENVMIFGQENSDGSVTAQNIQLGAPDNKFTF